MKIGDTVKLISTEKIDCEFDNWIEREPLVPQIEDEFKIITVEEDSNGIIFLSLYGLDYLHPALKFELVSVGIDTPDYYDNSKGSLYQLAQERGWNSYQFDIIKRVVRAPSKKQFFKDLKKTKDLIDLYILEQGHNFEGDE